MSKRFAQTVIAGAFGIACTHARPVASPEPALPTVPYFVATVGEGEIAGLVLDAKTGEGLAGAQVLASESPPRGGNTNARGEFIIRGVPPAAYIAKVRRIGYIPRNIPISISEGRGIAMTVFLDRDTVKLQNVCLPYLGHGLSVRVLDARTHLNILQGSIIVLRDGEFFDSTNVSADFPEPVWRAESVGERQGTYDVVVSHPGYKAWRKRDAVVAKAPDSCHVSPILLEAKLEPVDG